MSLFKTVIPVDLSPALSAMPKGAHVHSAHYDEANSEIILVWEHEKLFSGLTVAVDFALPDLKKRKLPKGVKDITPKKSVDSKPESGVTGQS